MPPKGKAANAPPEAGAPPGAGVPPTDGAPPDPGVPPGAEPPPSSGAPPGTGAPEEEQTQTPEELAFYARNHMFLTIMAVILFVPLGLVGLYFCKKTTEANKISDWEKAYLFSGLTGWVDVFAILIGLGLIYYYILFV